MAERNKTDFSERLRRTPYGKTLRSWLHALEESTKASPLDIENAIRQITAEKGKIVSPGHLENLLILKLSQKNSPAESKEQAHILGHLNNFLLELQPADHLTGWRQKPIVPRMVGLSAVQTAYQSAPTNTAVVKLDVTNMGGTNNFYERLLKIAQLKAPSTKDAEKLTDCASRILTAIIAYEFGTHIIEKARSGGDEAMLLVSGMPREKIESCIGNIEQKIADFVEEAGLNAHPHGKNPKNRIRRGYGAALDYIYLSDSLDAESYGEQSRLADRKISWRKKRIAKKQFAALSPHDKNRRGSAPDRLAHRFGRTAYAHNALEHTEKTFKKWEAKYGIKSSSEAKDKKTTLQTLLEDQHFTHYPTCREITETLFDAFAKEMANKNIDIKALPENFQELLKFRIAPFPGIDYATNTLIHNDLPALAVVNTKIALQHWHKTGRTPDSTVSALGINLHNLGGFNALGGQDNADKILAFAATLFKDTAEETGIFSHDFRIAHYGGGQFVLVGFPPTSTEQITQLSKNIVKKINDLNSAPLSSILGEGYDCSIASVKNDKPKRQKHESGLQVSIIQRAVLLEDIAANRIRIGRFIEETHEAINKMETTLRAHLDHKNIENAAQSIATERKRRNGPVIHSSLLLPQDDGGIDLSRPRQAPAPPSL